MAKVLEGLYYTESHEYVKVEGNIGYVGITDYAQHALGNVVYVDMPDVDAIIESARKALASDEPPKEPCYKPIPDGTSGNMKLSKGCAFCPFKDHCFPGLRKFKYADGVRYFTKIVKEPRVEEITDD